MSVVKYGSYFEIFKVGKACRVEEIINRPLAGLSGGKYVYRKFLNWTPYHLLDIGFDIVFPNKAVMTSTYALFPNTGSRYHRSQCLGGPVGHKASHFLAISPNTVSGTLLDKCPFWLLPHK